MERQGIQITVVRALSAVLGKLPCEISEWAQAMLFEASETGSAGEFVMWIGGVFTTTFQMLVSHGLQTSRTARPFVATCSAFYFGCLGGFVFLRLISEVVSATVPLLWGSMWMSVGRCAALTAVCLIVALGIWYLRSYARYAAIGVAVVQILAGISRTNLREFGSLSFAKLCVYVAIIILMSNHRVAVAFRKPPLESNDNSAHFPG